MGQLVNLKCKKCGYETNLGVGAGMLFNDLEKVITMFDKPTQDRIRTLVKENGQKPWYIYKEIGICEKCGKISAIAVFKSGDGLGNPVEFHGRCNCGSENINFHNFDSIQEGIATIPCPTCGETMEVNIQGNWD